MRPDDTIGSVITFWVTVLRSDRRYVDFEFGTEAVARQFASAAIKSHNVESVSLATYRDGALATNEPIHW